MRKIKYIIPVVLLFMVIGFATVTTSLSINADMELLGDLDNFAIYYSRAVVNGKEDSSIIVSSTELDFGAALKEVGTPYVIEYDITNASPSFDAEIEMTCSGSTEYFEVSNVFDTSTPLGARQTRTGTLTLKKIKTLAGDALNSTVSCTVVATPVERDSESSSSIPTPLVNPLYIGREIAIGDEKFNIISIDSDTVTLLAQYNVGTYYKQSATANSVVFANIDEWFDLEIDIQIYSKDVKNLLNDYVSNLNSTYGLSLTGDLITLSELGELGCTIPENYSIGSGGWTCIDSRYSDWLVNGQDWWTRSATPDDGYNIWNMTDDGSLTLFSFSGGSGVRPTITISKDIVYGLIDGNYYLIGQEVSLNGEFFNVISQTDTDVTLLAQYNLDPGGSKQVTTQSYNYFANSSGWPYTPGPKEADVTLWGGQSYDVLMIYLETLKSALNIDIDGSLISLNELSTLGCTITPNYSYSGNETCIGSPYEDWLVNGQYWWTQSASSENAYSIWLMHMDGSLYDLDIYSDNGGIRPEITISKSDLKNLDQSGTLISFSIMGKTYQALQGMTWGEWVNSEYNTSGNYIMSNNMITDSGGYPVKYEWVNVGVDEKIIANRDYENYS